MVTDTTGMTQPLCNVVDDVTGAVCTKDSPHEGEHRDESDPGCILTFPGEVPAKAGAHEGWLEEWYAAEIEDLYDLSM